jgi:hypothetical protein
MGCFEAVPNAVVVLGRAIEVAEIRFAANESAGLELAFGTPRAFVVIEVGLAQEVSRDEGDERTRRNSSGRELDC